MARAAFVYLYSILTLTWLVAISAPVNAQTPPETTPSPLDQQKLQADINRAKAETRKINAEANRDDGLPATLIRVGPLLTAVGAAVGVVLTWNKQLNESRERRRADWRLQEQDLQQRERERIQRFDELVTRALEKLGSDNSGAQAMGAASLRTFLQPRYKDVVADVLDIIRANLKLEREPVVYDMLRLAFEQALRLCVVEHQGLDARLDLTHTHLARVNLEGIDLQGLQLDIAFADLAHANLTGVHLSRLPGFKATLDNARLSRANLQEARLNEASCNGTLFHATNLVSATLKSADLRRADFRQACLQSAHLEKAHLEGTRFEEARLADSYFTDATFDAVALRSVTRARGWREAHFDPQTSARLEQL